MDFDRLRYLAAIERTGSLRGAAAALHVTPGAISKAIARLEADTQLQLLAPDGRGIRLTDAGAWLARRAQHLVGEHASIARDLATRRFRTSELCVATHDAFAAWLPAVLARTTLPGVPLSLRERWPGEVETTVAQAISDIGVTFMPVPTEGVTHEEVARVELGIFTARGAFPGAAIDAIPFAVPSHPISGATASYGPLDGWPADGAAQRDVRFRASSLEARLELARSGEAAVCIPKFVAARHDAMVAAKYRLERRDRPARGRAMTRRVYLVHRGAVTDRAGARTDAVRAAVLALCDGTASRR